MGLALLALGALFFVGHGLQWFFLKTKIPDLLVLIGIGYLVGPVAGWIDPADLGKTGDLIATVALAVILYEGGLHLCAKELLKNSGPAAALSILNFVFISTISACAAHYFALQAWPIAILFGLAVSATSAAIVIPMVKHLSIGHSTKTVLSLEAAFTDVLAIVVFLVVCNSFSSGEFSVLSLLAGIGPKTIISVGFGITGGIAWAWLRNRVPYFTEIAFAGEAWAIIIFGALESIHFNGAIGVFALGFTLSNLDFLPKWIDDRLSHAPIPNEELELLEEIILILRAFFFIYLGLLTRFDNTDIVIFGFAIAVSILVVRYLIVRTTFRPDSLERIDAMMITAMGPRGLASAVLATIPLQRGITGAEWLQTSLFALIPITILFTAVFVFLNERLSFRMRMETLFSSYVEDGHCHTAEPKEEKPLPSL